MRAELVWDARAELGEGPCWSARDQVLYWVDIRAGLVYAGADVCLQVGHPVGCIAPRAAGGLVLAEGHHFSEWNGSRAELTPITGVDEPSQNRFNDGKCDPAGRFLAGSMDSNEKESTGSLYSLEGRRVERLLSGLGISNGLAWSPDGSTFYFIDTPTRTIQAFDYDLATGRIANGRTAVQVPESLGWPDGMTSDMDGNLWVAMWGGAQVTQWEPDSGRLLQSIPVPAPHTTSCIFGGQDLNELYITSARKDLSARQLGEYPLSGGVFRVVTNLTGMPVFEFAPEPARPG